MRAARELLCAPLCECLRVCVSICELASKCVQVRALLRAYNVLRHFGSAQLSKIAISDVHLYGSDVYRSDLSIEFPSSGVY